MKKLLKILFGIAAAILVIILAVVLFQTYKPVLDAAKAIDEVDGYALQENERLQEIVTGRLSTGSVGEGFNFLNKLLPGTVRLNVPPAELYDGMLFVYETSPFTPLGRGLQKPE